MTPLQRRLAWRGAERDTSRHIDLRAYLLASFTIGPLAPYLGTALMAHGFTPGVTAGPFDQLFQVLHGERPSGLAPGDVVVVWQRLEDLWAGGPAPLLEGDTAAALAKIDDIGALCALRAADWGTTVVAVLPGVPMLAPLGVGDAGNRFGVGASAAAAREALRARVAGAAGVLVLDADDVIRALGAAAVDDRRAAAASIPYAEEAFAAFGDRIANLVRLERRGAKKVAVVDADNTLWGGVVGEDGAAGVDLADQGPGVAHRGLQRYLLDLRRAGMLVALASKNNEADAFEVFERRDMVLSKSDLATWRVDWNPKSANIEAMAEELNLGVASMVLIDDSAIERAEVGSALPEVACLEMPGDAALWPMTVAGSGMLDRLAPTSTDLGRAASYAQETKRREARAGTDLDSFLRSLCLEVELFVPGHHDLARLAQLVAKTNQFTLGGERHHEAALAAMLTDPAVGIRLVAARDEFGDYGIVGALIVRFADDPARAILDTFVLSCRAMGRGIEDAMLAEAVGLAPGRTLVVTVEETPKNQPLRQWLGGIGIGTAPESPVPGRAWPVHVARLRSSD